MRPVSTPASRSSPGKPSSSSARRRPWPATWRNERCGRTLLLRGRVGSKVTATADGQLLWQYARRLLALSQEAQDALASDMKLAPVRIGVPEDFDARWMSAMLSGFVRAKPDVRL